MIDTGLNGAVVLVTGGASGIGAAVSRAFAEQGARVAVHYLDSTDAAPEGAEWEHDIPARTEAEQLASALPNAVAIGVDLSEEGSETVLLDAVAASLGEVDVLINNAAHCESPDTYQELSTASLTRHYRVNAIAPAALISKLARRRAGNEVRVVNISTDAARAFPGQVGYGSSKAALEALTRGAAIDLGGPRDPGQRGCSWTGADRVDERKPRP